MERFPGKFLALLLHRVERQAVHFFHCKFELLAQLAAFGLDPVNGQAPDRRCSRCLMSARRVAPQSYSRLDDCHHN